MAAAIVTIFIVGLSAFAAEWITPGIWCRNHRFASARSPGEITEACQPDMLTLN
jgi:hypothetical protein